MKLGIYPGSFNPWHEGHDDILTKALKVFDKVIVAVGTNPDKSGKANLKRIHYCIIGKALYDDRAEVKQFDGLLVDYVREIGADAVIRGLRTGSDLEYERAQQYWNEDLGIRVPTVYFLCDRKHSHISSSAIRSIKAVKKSSETLVDKILDKIT